MAEYGSGIFYSRYNNYQNLSTLSQLGLLSLPPELDIGIPISQTLKGNHEMPRDMILLAEFSEIEGPIPLLSVPISSFTDININDFVLQLMSTDYQSMGGSGFQILKDTCLLQEDAEKSHYIYVHYFTLYDVQARGFVRPMCLAYVSREPEKLKRYFKHIKECFSKVTELLRICNLQVFCKELKNRIEDLSYTKERYIYSQKSGAQEYSEKKFTYSQLNKEKKETFTKVKRKRTSSFNSDANSFICEKMRANISATKSHSLDKLSKFRKGRIHHSAIHISSNIRFTSCASPAYQHQKIVSSSLPVNQAQGGFYSPIIYRKDPQTPTSCFRSHFHSHQRHHNGLKDSAKDAAFEALSYSSDSSCSTITGHSGLLGSSKDDSKNSKAHFTLVQNSGYQAEDLEEASVLQHTNLDTLAVQLLDCQSILQVTKDYLKNSIVENEVKDFMDEVKSNPQSPLYAAMDELGMIKEESEKPDSRKPVLFVVSLLRRSYRNMRSVRALCGVGYVAAVARLLEAYHRFSKATLTLFFEELDKELYENPLCTLFMGAIPVVKVTDGCGRPTPFSPSQNRCAGDILWNDDLVQLLRVDQSEPTGVILSGTFCNSDNRVTVADDCLEVFTGTAPPSIARADSFPSSPVTEEDCLIKADDNCGSNAELSGSESGDVMTSRLRSTSSNLSWASSTPKDYSSDEDLEEDGEEEVVCDVTDRIGIKFLRHDIHRRMEIEKLYHMTALINQFSGAYQCILHSVLSGKTIVVAAPDRLKSVVVLYTKTLSTILSPKLNEVLPVLKWHTGTITPHHLNLYKIIGTCIPERLHVQDLMSNATLNQVTVLNIETGHISGVAYSGTLLRKADQLTRRYFRSDPAVQAALQSILLGVGMKVFLHFHLLRTTSRSSSEILRGIGVARGDWHMIEYLSQFVMDQLSYAKQFQITK